LIGLEVVLDQVDRNDAHLRESLELLRSPIEDAIRRIRILGSNREDDRKDTKTATRVEPVTVIRLDSHSLLVGATSDSPDQQAIIDRYTLLGSLRGLADAITGTRTAMSKVDWGRIFTPRF
jgi:hypothetical protein